jgi:hypothetical protein
MPIKIDVDENVISRPKLQSQSLCNSRRGDGSHGILVQALNQSDDLLTCHGRVVELFLDFRTVAVRVCSRHMNNRLHRNKGIRLGTKRYCRKM